MKKTLSVIICLLLVPALIGACAEISDLNSIFESGHASLVPVSVAESIGFDPGMFSDNWMLISVSPDGSTYLFVIEGAFVAVRKGTIHIMQPNYERGAEDVYGNLKSAFSMGFYRALDYSGIVWSPDGRYFSMTAYDRVMVNGRMEFDPFLFDTETGDVFLPATYANKIKDENFGAVSEAAFSPDGRYFYFRVYRNSMNRYDLQTGENEVFLKMEDMDPVCRPAMCVTGDGSVLCLADPVDRKEPGKLMVYTQVYGVWVTVSRTLPIGIVGEQATGFVARKMAYSAQNGNCLIVSQENGSGKNYMSLFNCDSDSELKHMRHFTLRDDGTSARIVEISTEDIDTEYWQALINRDMPAASAYPYLTGCSLSPNGEFAFFAYSSPDHNGSKAALVKLETLEMIEVELPETLIEQARFWESALTAAYKPGAVWLGDGRLLAYSSAGTTELFAFAE